MTSNFQHQVKIRIAGEDKSGPAFDAVGARLNGLKSSLSELGGALAAAGIGLSLTGLVATFKSVADELDRVSKAAQKVGLDVEVLSALEYAAGQSGLEVAGLEANLTKLNKTAVEAAHGNKDQAETFAALGVSVSDAAGRMKSTDTMLLELADSFARFADGPEKAELAMRVFGKSGTDMIPMLNAGRAGITDLMAEAKTLGVVMNGEAAAAAEAFNDNLDRLSTSMRGVAMAAGQDALPALREITDAMAEAAKEGGILRAVWVGMGGGADQLINGTELSNLRDRANEFEAEVKRLRKLVEEGSAPIPFTPFKIEFNAATLGGYKAALVKAEAELGAARNRIEAILNPPKSGGSADSALAESLRKTKEEARSLNEELRALGIDPKRFELSEAEIAKTFEHIAGNAKATGDQILTTLLAVLDRVGNETAPNLAAALTKAFGDGRISAAQLEAGIGAITTKAEGLWAAMDLGAEKAKALEAAYKTLGITSQESLNTTALKAKEAYELIKASGAGVGTLNEAWKKYAEAAIAANGGVATATVTAQAAMNKYSIEVDAAGKAHVAAMGAALASTKALAAAEQSRRDAENKAKDAQISELEKQDPAAAEAERQRQAQEALRAADLANAHATVNGLHGYKEADQYRAEASAQTQRATDLAGQFKDPTAAKQVVDAVGTIAAQAASAQEKSTELAAYRAGAPVPDAIPMNAPVRIVQIDLSLNKGTSVSVQANEQDVPAVLDLFEQIRQAQARS